MAVILNEPADLAPLGCDGVMSARRRDLRGGEADGPRSMVGVNGMIAATRMEAAEAGDDYVAFGSSSHRHQAAAASAEPETYDMAGTMQSLLEIGGTRRNDEAWTGRGRTSGRIGRRGTHADPGAAVQELNAAIARG